MARQRVGCALGTVKTLMIVINVLFLLIGAAVLAVGINAKAKLWKSTDLLGVSPEVIYGVIILGALVFVIAFLGCCGSIRHSRSLLSGYFILVALLLVGQVVVVSYAATHRSEVEKHAWDQLSADDRQEVEKDLNCCGFYTEPNSDCIGCKQALDDRIDKYMKQIIIITASVAAFQVVALISACCLICGLPKKGERESTALLLHTHQQSAQQANYVAPRAPAPGAGAAPAANGYQAQPQPAGLYPDMRA